jgi:hypothetical protein
VVGNYSNQQLFPYYIPESDPLPVILPERDIVLKIPIPIIECMETFKFSAFYDLIL